jgi:hypothetical protein
MTEGQTDRQPTPGRDPYAQDEAVPLRETPITQPRLTLPSAPCVGRPARRLLPPRSPSSSFAGQDSFSTPDQAQPSLAKRRPAHDALLRSSLATGEARQASPRVSSPGRLSDFDARSGPIEADLSTSGARSGPIQIGRKLMLPPRHSAPTRPPAPRKEVTVISAGQRGAKRIRRGEWAWHSIPGRVQAIMILCVLVALAAAITFGGVLKGGLEPQAVQFAANGGSTSLQSPTPALPPGLNTTDINYYITKYGFDAPKAPRAIPKDEQQRLAQMMPYALAATARYDARYDARVEPEMLLWWTHAEQIGARINYSNCANEAPPPGQTYFSSIMNCDRPDFWQLGYGNQFGNIWVLKDAFTDMHGNPNDPALVQKVGQAVLDYDRSQHTTPQCGGYSCTFPAMTIDQIMADVHWHASDHKETESNWWASVLSRDPGINSYMLALALSSFSHQQTKNWVGCYYQEPCWQYESDSLWAVLAIWKSLGG